jgi:hypothetical protein
MALIPDTWNPSLAAGLATVGSAGIWSVALQRNDVISDRVCCWCAGIHCFLRTRTILCSRRGNSYRQFQPDASHSRKAAVR